MAYVDLNPVRARMARSPEQSDHTSIQQRIKHALNTSRQEHQAQQQPKALLNFVGNPRQDMPKGLPFNLTDYLQLVDWSGRLLREDKKGHITDHLPDILQRLNIAPNISSTLASILNHRSKTWSAMLTMSNRHVMNSANSGYMASASAKNTFRVVS